MFPAFIMRYDPRLWQLGVINGDSANLSQPCICMAWGVARKNWNQDKEGYASLPEGPGLGVDVDEKLMAKVAADPKRRFRWPVPRAADGSVRDY